MTNSFNVELTGKDNLTPAVEKSKKSLVGLIGTLNSAAAAYERLAVAQAKMVQSKGTSGNLTVNIKNITGELGRQANAERAAQAAGERKAEAIAAALRVEERALAAVLLAQQKAIAGSNLARAKGVADSQAKAAALAQEEVRVRALVAIYKEQVAANKSTRQAARGNSIANPDDLKAAQAYKIATQEVKLSLDRLKSTQADLRGVTTAQTQATNAEAAALRSATQAAEAQARAELKAAQATQTNATSLNATRYALYQVAAAYASVAKGSSQMVKSVLDEAISFQAAFSQVARTTGLGMLSDGLGKDAEMAATELAILRSDLVGLSTDIGTSFQDLTVVGALGAQLGIASGDVSEFTQVTAKFAATTNVTTEAAATYFGRLQNILDVPTVKFRNLASAVSELGVNSVATESEILAVTTQIGAMANNAGFSAQYVLGLGTALASVRVAPELARGTTTRVFQNISRAAADGGKEIEAFGRIMGISGKEAQALWESNPDQFFSQLINGLGAANDAGQNLTPLLDSIGVKGARDVPVITRLANSYQLLAQYTDLANTSFADGGYLDSSFAEIQKTAQNALNRLSASFAAFKDAAGQAFLPLVTIIANGLSTLFNVLSKVPAPILATVVALTAGVAVLFAIRTAAALGGAAMLAMSAATKGLGVDQLRVGTIISAVNARLREQAAAAAVAAGGTRALAGADAGLVAANAGLVASNTAVGFSFKALFASIGPAGWLLLGVSALAGLLVGMKSGHDDAAEAAMRDAAAQKTLNDEWINAGAGADELRKAIAKDTAAYKAAGNEANATNGVYQVLQKSTKEVSTATEDTAAAISAAAGVQPDLQSKTKATAKTVDDLTVALGNNVKEWERKAAAEQLSDAFNSSEGLQNALTKIPKDVLNKALEAGLTEGKAGVDRVLADTRADTERLIAGIDQNISDMEAKVKDITGVTSGAFQDLYGPGKLLEGSFHTSRQAELDTALAFLDTSKKELAYQKEQIAAYDLIASKSQEMKKAIESAATADAISSIVKEAYDLTDAMEDPIEAAETLKDVLNEAADAFSGLYDSASAAGEFEGALSSGLDKLGQSLVENGANFSRFTEEGRANFAALDDVVKTFTDNQAAQIAAGTQTAGDAAAATAQFVSDLMSELSDQDVDVSQLQYLADYASALTNHQWRMAVDADVTPAVAQMQALQQFASGVLGLINQTRSGLSAWITGKGKPDTSWSTTGFNAPPVAAAPKTPAFVAPSLAAGVATAKHAAEQKKLEEAEKSAGKAGKEAGQAEKDAQDDAAEAVKKHQEYLDDLADGYSKLGSTALSGVAAEGSTFEALQKLGIAIDENGKKFNSMTESGRANFSALTDVFDAFGATLEDRIKDGTLTAQGAADEFAQFAQGVYGELVQMGVPAAEIQGFFDGLGVSAKGWDGSIDSVKQYAGFMSAAAKATEDVADATKLAQEITERYSEELQKVFDARFGLQAAADDTRTAMNEMKDAYQSSIDKVKELRAENRSLSADLAGKKAEKRKAEIEAGISRKYGETDRAKDYQAQADKAGTDIAEIKNKMGDNRKEITALDKGRNALKGNSKEAINNRKSLRELQQQMLNQIQTYADTGASTQEVADYTVKMKDQFIKAGEQAGYTKDDIKKYTDVFGDYKAAIEKTPKTVQTEAKVKGITDSKKRLDSIPHGARTLTTTAKVKIPDSTRKALANLPKAGDYVIKPKVDSASRSAAANSLGGLTGTRTVPIKPQITGSATDLIADFFVGAKVEVKALPPSGGGGGSKTRTTYMGGLIGPNHGLPGYAHGGLVGGTPPRQKYADNLLVTAPGGMAGLRSGEYVVPEEPTRQYLPWLDYISGKTRGISSSPHAGGGGGGQEGFPSSMVAELSPIDRQLLVEIRNARMTLYADSQRVASSVGKGNTALANRGRG